MCAALHTYLNSTQTTQICHFYSAEARVLASVVWFLKQAECINYLTVLIFQPFLLQPPDKPNTFFDQKPNKSTNKHRERTTGAEFCLYRSGKFELWTGECKSPNANTILLPVAPRLYVWMAEFVRTKCATQIVWLFYYFPIECCCLLLGALADVYLLPHPTHSVECAGLGLLYMLKCRAQHSCWQINYKIMLPHPPPACQQRNFWHPWLCQLSQAVIAHCFVFVWAAR